MPIFFPDEIQKNKYILKKKCDIYEIKKLCIQLSFKNNINYIPIKIIYLIIYLKKYNYNFKIINKIIYKVLKKKYIVISKFINKIIKYKWLNIINISIINKVENELFNYFFKLYELYLNNELNNDIYKYQIYFIFNKRIAYYSQFKRFIKSNIYTTYFFIDIILSKISKKNIIIENIFIIN